jgi:hypothetical protein
MDARFGLPSQTQRLSRTSTYDHWLGTSLIKSMPEENASFANDQSCRDRQTRMTPQEPMARAAFGAAAAVTAILDRFPPQMLSSANCPGGLDS